MEKLGSLAALHGKTVYYVPIAQHTAQFATTADALKQTLDVAGLSLRVSVPRSVRGLARPRR
jgi:hypothetical protein